MRHEIDAGVIVASLASTLYVLLGAWVLRLKPRRRQTTLLGAFAVLFGLWFATTDLLPVVYPVFPGVRWLIWPLFSLVAAAVGIVSLMLAASVPRPLEDRRLLAVALVIGFAFSTVAAATYPAALPFLEGFELAINVVGWQFVGQGATWATAALLALRAHPSREPTVDGAVQLAILAVGFALFWEFLAGTELLDVAGTLALGRTAASLNDAVVVAVWLTVAGLWGRNMVAAPDETVGVHRAAMVAILAVMLAGAVTEAVLFASLVEATVAGAVVRILGFGVLAYGILRHDLAGLDAKVEWGVSKTTVAGVFVAMFFVAGELAETFFGEVLGPYVGIIAAGGLVFALSPLQRMADRVAAKAVPAPAAPQGEGGEDDEATYRRAVRKYLADGALTDAEERDLGRLAARLGVDAQRAIEIRQEVEADVGEGGGEGA